MNYISAMMSTLRFGLLAAGTVVLTGMFHNHLVKSSPAADERLAASPADIRLWFNERPEIPFTSVTILTADSTKIVTIKAVATADTMAASAPLASPLAPGSYMITWRTASRDGHAIRGTYRFSIAP